MGLVFALVCAFFLGAMGAQAQTINCSKSDQVMVRDAIGGAKTLSLRAATAIADDVRYGRWFGKYRPDNAERVRATFKAVHDALRSGTVQVICEAERSAECGNDTYAFVYPDEPFFVHLCRPFFDLPSMAGMRPMREDSDNGTREGTIIHEVTHFQRVASTDDNCYSRTDCSEMAQGDSFQVVRNADSFQYFAEDIMFFGTKDSVKASREAEVGPATGIEGATK